MIANVILISVLKIAALENKKVKTVVMTSIAYPTIVTKGAVKNLTFRAAALKIQIVTTTKVGVSMVTANFDKRFPIVSKIVNAVPPTALLIYVYIKHLVKAVHPIKNVSLRTAQIIYVPLRTFQEVIVKIIMTVPKERVASTVCATQMPYPRYHYVITINRMEMKPM